MAKAAVFLLRQTRWYHGYWNHWRSFYSYAERNGLHITPVHFHSPLPDTRALPESLWSSVPYSVGFDLNIEESWSLLATLSRTYNHEFEQFVRDQSHKTDGFRINNISFGAGDADVLYAMVRHLKPARMVEIGSGNSTHVACAALHQNKIEGHECHFTCIDPYPTALVSSVAGGISRFERTPLQQASTTIFSDLRKNDVLFIDSTHVAATGSDVVHVFRTILPILEPGVVVHIHDIFTPFEYPRWWVKEELYFWNEQYFLEAFLTFNDKFEVLLPLHALRRFDTEQLWKLIPSLRESTKPGLASFWIRRR